ncbi:hypothetical protein ACYOEI_30640 [Singulisphaera rosea]
MNPRHYHNPVNPPTTRVRCPVCHEVVYSTAGIHPQCAVKQSDPPKPKEKPPKAPVPGHQDPQVPEQAGSKVASSSDSD